MGEHLFERLARERNITVEEMRTIISARIKDGMILTRRNGRSGEGYPAREKSLRRMNGCGMLLRNCRKKGERIYCGGILIYKYCRIPV